MTRELPDNKALLLTLLFLTALPVARAQAPPGNSTVPPEILRQFDQGLVEGVRPRIATISEADIAGLRETPERRADLVRFDFEPAQLSKIERKTLGDWIGGGKSKIYLEGNDLYRFGALFGLSATNCPDGTELVDDPVSTDCSNLDFPVLCVVRGLERWHGEAYVVSARDPSAVACGSFSFGDGSIFFAGGLPVGGDSRRWYLNFMSRALGLRIPDKAGAGEIDSAKSDREVFQPYDQITLTNGNKLTGRVRTAKFTLKTSRATLTLDRDKIDTISIGGAGGGTDEVRTTLGVRLNGTLQERTIKFRFAAGGEVSIKKAKIKEIRILIRNLMSRQGGGILSR